MIFQHYWQMQAGMSPREREITVHPTLSAEVRLKQNQTAQ